LRRSALGIINIILDKGYRKSLNDFITASLDLLESKLTRKREEVHAGVLEFFKGRFVNLMADRFPADVVEAVAAASFDDLNETAAKIEALAVFKRRADFEQLAVTFKRVCNIVKDGVHIPVDEQLFQDQAEAELFSAFMAVKCRAGEKIVSGDYLDALVDIASLRGAVDAFFVSVMVMADDEKLKNNRLALLTEIAGLFGNIADFAKISA
jgi:glycyl-tRNA synthetase beta chain